MHAQRPTAHLGAQLLDALACDSSFCPWVAGRGREGTHLLQAEQACRTSIHAEPQAHLRRLE